ncbi:MAG: serine/threonine-protein kinase, partial [Gemmataceae bacterium]
ANMEHQRPPGPATADHAMTIDPERDPLDVIAEEFASRCRQGETPSIAEYLLKYPSLATELQDLLPAVAQMETLKVMRQKHPTVIVSEPLLQLPGYKVHREIGRGGMGIVYQATDEKLGRPVAIKVLPAIQRLNRERVARFLREAQAMARLQHSHIVPVYQIGEIDRVPYYVMQFIEGCSLHEVLSGWKRPASAVPNTASTICPNPRQWRRLARWGQAAAAALHAAHRSGVLHRDVKPANLLLDRSGHLWVTDFGLAKLTNTETLTATGEVMGTLQYMAPETLHGSSDARTDVYSLGMTLYQLLTQRLPFEETNPAMLLKQIETARPTPPRAIDPGIPRDLETIVLKAITREPAGRYPTAGALAEDLDAYLAGEPIHARRQTTLERAITGCRRNPSITIFALATMTVLLAAAGFGWVMYAKARVALNQEAALRLEAQQANQRLGDEQERTREASRKLDANFQRSLAVLEQILEAATNNSGPPGGGPYGPGGPRFGPGGPYGPGGTSGPGGGSGPVGPGNRMSPMVADVQVLQGIISFYESYAQQNATDPKLRFDAARTYRRIGEIQSLLRRPTEAEPNLLKA